MKNTICALTCILLMNLAAGVTVAVASDDVNQEENKVTFTAEQEYLFKIFKERRSVRQFKADPIPREHLEMIIDIARSAPTSGNQQPWKFLVLQDQGKIAELKKFLIDAGVKRTLARNDKLEEAVVKERYTTYYGEFLSAPAYIAVIVDNNSKYPSYNIKDGSLAAGYLMIAARALGYGTVFATDSVPFEALKEVFNIPDHYEGICFTPVGVPVEWPETPPKKELNDLIWWDAVTEQ